MERIATMNLSKISDLLREAAQLQTKLEAVEAELKQLGVVVTLAAYQMGKRGGKKGGLARAAALSPTRRSEIASKAAKARWKRGTNP